MMPSTLAARHWPASQLCTVTTTTTTTTTTMTMTMTMTTVRAPSRPRMKETVMKFERDEQRGGPTVTPVTASAAVASVSTADREEVRAIARDRLDRLIVSFAQFFDTASGELGPESECRGDVESNNVTTVTCLHQKERSDVTSDNLQRRRRA